MLGVLSSSAVARKKVAAERQLHPVGDVITVDRPARERIAAERAARGMSQRDLAARIGVSVGTISNIESGRHQQQRKTIMVAIHAVFGWPAPTGSVISDVAYQRIVDGALEITDEDRLMVAEFIERLKAKR